MAILSVIRRWHLRDGVPIREIARRTRLSRNTIRKYLASAVVEPKYPKRKNPSKLDGLATKLTAWLTAEARKGRKQRRNLRRLYADLVALGFQASYDRVAAFARSWRQAQQELARTAGRGTFVPLAFAPGEAFQFDRYASRPLTARGASACCATTEGSPLVGLRPAIVRP